MADLEGTALAFKWGEQVPSAHVYLAPVVLNFLHRSGARRVLDLGCGNGTFTARIAEAGYEVVGIDASSSGIQIATRLVPQGTFLESSLEHPLPQALRGQFDAVTAVEVIEHLPMPGVLCARAREALRPDGQFVVTTPYHGYLKNLALALSGQLDSHWQPWRDGGHIKFFSRATVTELIRREGFDPTAFVRVGRIPPFAKSMVIESRLKK
jgi:2-polyprenyl-6-hydroxyphenyl methylase/3-demethylubiquinone-9 3-methyltransferase